MARVVVAEDEFAVLEVLAMALELEGHGVHKAGDGEHALHILATAPCDLAIVDERMPLLDGLGVLAAMRATPRLAEIPVIAMHERAASWASGPRVVSVAKPIVLLDVLDLVRSLVG